MLIARARPAYYIFWRLTFPRLSFLLPLPQYRDALYARRSATSLSVQYVTVTPAMTSVSGGGTTLC